MAPGTGRTRDCGWQWLGVAVWQWQFGWATVDECGSGSVAGWQLVCLGIGWGWLLGSHRWNENNGCLIGSIDTARIRDCGWQWLGDSGSGSVIVAVWQCGSVAGWQCSLGFMFS
jgi:hypothetical protein